MGIFPTDIPLDESGLNADMWHFQLSEPLSGHHVGALLELGVSVEPVTVRTMRRIAGGMGSMLIGAIRVAGGAPFEVGDCSELRILVAPPAPAPEPVVEPPNPSVPAAAPASVPVPDAGAAVPTHDAKKDKARK